MTQLEEAWRKLEKSRFGGTVEVYSLPRYSKHPVSKLIWAFKISLCFVIAFLILFAYLVYIMPQPIVKVLMSIVIIAYMYGFWINWKMLQQITKLAVFDQDVLSNLKMIYESTTKMLAFQRKAALYFYPVAATAGFVMGLSIEGNATELMMRWEVLLVLVIVTAILVPVGYKLALWMENYSFGKMLNSIKVLIDEMSTEEKEDQ